MVTLYFVAIRGRFGSKVFTDRDAALREARSLGAGAYMFRMINLPSIPPWVAGGR